MIPFTDDQHDLGNSIDNGKIYSLMDCNIDSLDADTADIDGGTIDGTTIGAGVNSIGAANGTFTRVQVDDIRIDGNTIVTTNTNGNLNLILMVQVK